MDYIYISYIHPNGKLVKKIYLLRIYIKISTKKLNKKDYLLSWSVVTIMASLVGPSPFTVDANTVIV